MNIKFKIVTPEKTVLKKEISQAVIPTTDGEITILPNHRSYIAELRAGEILVKCPTEKDSDCAMAVSGGFVEFADNKLVILADTAERAEEIDLQKAEEAKRRAEELKKKKISADDTDYARVVALLEKEMNRIKVAKRYLRRKGL